MSFGEDSPTGRERELQALLHEKETELEERSRLLFKTKLAIEQLQQELIATKREGETARERAVKAQEEMRSLQLQVQKQEEELAARYEEAEASERELKHYAAENQDLQGRLAEVEEDKDKLVSRNKALEARLREAEQDASTARAEAHRNMDQLTQLDQDMRVTEASLASVQEQLHQALQEQEDNEQVVREVVHKNKALQEELTSTRQALESLREALEQAKRQVASLENTLNTERVKAAADQHSADAALSQSQRDSKRQLAEAESRVAALQEQATQLKGSHARQLEEVRQQHEVEKGTSEAAWAVAKAETQQQWLSALQNLQQKSADQLAAQLANSAEEASKAAGMWQAKLTIYEEKLSEARSNYEAQRSAMQQRLIDSEASRNALEASWQRRLLDAEQGQTTLKAEVHAKLLIVSERLEGLVAREAKHAARRGQLMQAIDALHRAGHEEGRRHRKAEAAMQEAVTLFKAELAEKTCRLASLQADLRQLKDWQAQSIHCLKRGMACPASPDRLRPPTANLRPRSRSRPRTAHLPSAGKYQCPLPLNDNRATGVTFWSSPTKKGHGCTFPHSAPVSPWHCGGHSSSESLSLPTLTPAGKQADRFSSSDEYSDFPQADGHVHVCYPGGPPKHVRKWCQNLTDELGSAMHRLQTSLSPERPRT